MKRIVMALAALSVLAPVAAMAQTHHDTVEKKVIIKQEPMHHRHWDRGRVLPHEYRGNVVVYERYHLRRPGPDRVWVKARGQYLLINKRTGVIVETATPR